MKKTDIVLGLQFGSEGKGNVVGRLSLKFQYDYAIRTGSANAGHSYYYRGSKRVFRYLPSIIYEECKAVPVLARGCLINFKVLLDEIERLNFKQYKRKIVIDKWAYPILQQDIDHEVQTGMSQKIGSTCEGVGSAYSNRVMRVKRDITEYIPKEIYDIIEVCDTEELKLYEKRCLVEVPQGAGLSLYSKHFPFTTSRDVSIYEALSQIQSISFEDILNVYGVVRTYPIRVGGNSGDMKNEITWTELSKRLGREIIEYTTVTKRIRRVAEFDYEMISKHIRFNCVNRVCLTFCDYLIPNIDKFKSGLQVDDKIRVEQVPVEVIKFWRSQLKCVPYMISFGSSIEDTRFLV